MLSIKQFIDKTVPRKYGTIQLNVIKLQNESKHLL